ncbi:SDR family oxidoreductase [Vibrio sp. Of7-15]|uniref:SDR family NAD(P)-dependent oxidoreductase n=1 Tax=Vibrio sp. Of7-15 TaxID=2724879 RepID=UPI001EF18233|nr:SDR family oxidoreductase [Vibrio sp. Of7-15]MCG7497164.1 SDR family oxidoreductase [Vibrio sp. Of7-15]
MKTVLITGGSKGIGLSAVLRYQKQGHKVITCSRNTQTWNEAVTRFPELANVDFQSVDLADNTQVEHFFDHIREQYSVLDIAINNASPKLASGGVFSEVPVDALFSTLQCDFWAHALCLKYELQLMKQGSTVVNVSSVNGFRPTPNAAMYSASKHAIEGLTHSVALEAIKQGIRINAVSPGVTWTPRWQDRVTQSQPGLKEEVEAAVPLARFANTDEIVNAIEWLCSDQSSYVVGHTLVVDGGLSLA